MLQNATHLSKSAPGPCLMNMSLVLRPPRKMHLCRPSSNVPRLPSFLDMLQNPDVLLTFNTVHNPLHLPGETTLQSPNVVRPCGAFNILTCFDFEICFAPQRCALFRHLNLQKCSEPVSFYTFDIEMCFAPQRRTLF